MTVHAGTVLKVLGKSSLFILDILIRESVQNSLDAVSSKVKECIRFDFDIVEFESIDKILSGIGFLEKNGSDPLFTRLKQRIKENDPVLLILSDKGTTGLSGPVRRSDAKWNSPSDRKNFENLVYQLGQNHGTSGAGGSYGFGKSIYYRLSSAGLVMYYSRSREGERLAFNMISPEERKALSASTGISWWGELYKHKGTEYSAPVIDSEKIGRILTQMGLIKKRFGKTETGTLICIVAPDLRKLLSGEEENGTDSGGPELTTGEKIEKISKLVQEAVIRWYWPRLTVTDENRPGGNINPLKFFYRKQEVLLPQQYKGLSELLRAAENSNNGIAQNDNSLIKTVQIRHSYGNAYLGTVAWQIIDMESSESHLNKIAMIRAPRMVVFEIPVQIKPEKSVAAVFLVNSAANVYAGRESTEMQPLDDAFRDCESATHSEWNYHDFPPEKNWFKSYVKTVRDKVAKIINQALNPNTAVVSEKTYSETAKALGQILLAESLGGVQAFPQGGSGSGGGGNTSGSAKPLVRILDTWFKNNNSAVFLMEVSRLRKGSYGLFIMAKGGKELYDVSSWKQNLGEEFPFLISGAVCNTGGDPEIIDHSYVRFTVTTENNPVVQFSLDVKFIKRDALITFLVKSLSEY